MKRIGLYILLACLFSACQKEEGITPGIGFENLYTIQDDPSDSIQHKRYEIYQTYGVPVFFNDTIGKVFVKKDINGDSVFHYETLDLNWAFSGTNKGSVTYQVTRHTDPASMMKSLQFAEVFLANCQAALYPHALWLAEKCYQLSSTGVTEQKLISRYRNLLFASVESIKESERQEKALNYRNEVVKQKILNYSDELDAFKKVTDESMYESTWWDIFPDERVPYYYPASSFTDIWFPRPLAEEWEQDSSFRRTMKNQGNYTHPDWPQGPWSDEIYDRYVLHCRQLVGSIGFVGYDMVTPYIRLTPPSPTADLDLYLIEMMKYPRKEFLKRWEDSPLVLKKYEILYAIIRDKLGVEL